MSEMFKNALDKALADPKSAYGTPAAVLEADELSHADKRKVLLQWEQDARQLQVATDENMAGGEPPMLSEVMRALAALDGPRAESASVPTKSGAGAPDAPIKPTQ